MAQGAADQAAQSPMSALFPGYPWHAAQCGDIDLTGNRKPQSYYRDILWNGGDRVYATVRLPEPEGKKIVARVGRCTRRCRAGLGPDRKERDAGGSLFGRGEGPPVPERQADWRESQPGANSNSRRCLMFRTRRAL